MNKYDELGKQTALDAIKALFDAKQLTLDELLQHLTRRPVQHFTAVLPAAKNNPPPAA